MKTSKVIGYFWPLIFFALLFFLSCGSGALGDYLTMEIPVDSNIDQNPVEDIFSGIDYDGDGYSALDDCNDFDPAINPVAEEIFDGVDNDCDSYIDEIVFDVSGKGTADLTDLVTSSDGGKIIQLTGGELDTTEPIVISKSVSIVGDRTNRFPIKGNGAFDTVFVINADNVTLDGLDISGGVGDLVVTEGAHSGIVLKRVVVHGSTGGSCVRLQDCTNCKIQGVVAYNCADEGMSFVGGDGLRVEGSSVTGSKSDGGAINITMSNNVTLIGNKVSENTSDHGIKIDKCGGSIFLGGNEIASNAYTSKNAAEAFKSGIFLYKSLTDTSIDVANNLLEDNQGRAFYITKASGFDPVIKFGDNVIINQTLDIIGASGDPSCQFEGNKFINNNSNSLVPCEDLGGNTF